ncbi:MAG: polysaccharide biosynthesis/export family protein [Weeksellaceae bacterium]|nr:polysaccharide biosynthesis/export family protein [Weeksellaceae bacterium]
MKIKLKNILYLIVFSFIIFSCAKRENVVYFNDAQTINTFVQENAPKIQINDKLKVSVYATDATTTAPFNLQSSSTNDTEGKTYLVDQNGAIDMPILGKVNVKGLTRIEAQDLIQEKVSFYIKNTSVNVSFADFKITILGEVNSPGTKVLPSEKVSIIDAIGLAGDLKINGVRNNIMVIRNTEGQVESHRVDLTSKEIFNSPVYYLAQNDVIYVEPNKSAIQNASSTRTITIAASIIGLVLSITTIITRL